MRNPFSVLLEWARPEPEHINAPIIHTVRSEDLDQSYAGWHVTGIFHGTEFIPGPHPFTIGTVTAVLDCPGDTIELVILPYSPWAPNGLTVSNHGDTVHLTRNRVNRLPPHLQPPPFPPR